MILKKILVLVDNYIWILHNIEGFCIIIDPGLSEPVIEEIKRNKWSPVAIFLTHNHEDHTKGVKNIVKNYPKITVFGPNETKENYVNKIISEGDQINILNKKFYVFFTPGHTLGHVSYYMKPYIFCGDTLFSAGCGRVYKNNYLKMYRSIQLIKSLPDCTFLCCSHEYTLLNLKFSMSILKDDEMLKIYFKNTKKNLYFGRSSLPSYILFEKRINLFLRTSESILKKEMNLDKKCTSFEVFVKLRLKRNFFIGAKRD